MSILEDHPEIHTRASLIFEQVQKVISPRAVALILEVRGIFSGHTPPEEWEKLAQKANSWFSEESAQ